MKGIFVTGTNTGAGKTAIAAGLALSLKKRGFRVAVMKPVQTGGIIRGGELVSGDLEMTLSGLNLNEPRELLNPYCLPEPCSPHLAAKLANIGIIPRKIIDAYRQLSSRYDIVIVEGAGGLLVPIREDYLMADLARDLDLPLLIVADNILGVINHTLLTIECARNRKLDIAGMVFNHTSDSTGPIQEDNPKIVAQISGVNLLGKIPFQPNNISAESMAELLDKNFNFDLLLG